MEILKLKNNTDNNKIRRRLTEKNSLSVVDHLTVMYIEALIPIIPEMDGESLSPK